MLKWFLPVGVGVAQVELSTAVRRWEICHSSQTFLSHEEVACSKENPVASALSYVHLMSKCVSCNR